MTKTINSDSKPPLPQDLHTVKLSEFFGGPDKLNSGLGKPSDLSGVTPIIIAFTNRCGSNYLAELLASSGQFNLAGEVLNYDTVISRCSKNGCASLDAHIADLMRTDQVCGKYVMKASIKQLEMLAHTGIASGLLAGAKYILIERADKLGQAISYQIALHTNQWTSYMSANGDRDEVKPEPQLIQGILQGLANQYRLADLLFSQQGIIPALVSYENLSAWPEDTVRMTLHSLGLEPCRVDRAKVKTERQATLANQNLRASYMKLMAAA